MKKNIAILSPHDDKFSSPAIIELVNNYSNLNFKVLFLQKDFFIIKKKISLLFIFTLFEMIRIFFKKKISIIDFCKEKNVYIKQTKDINSNDNLKILKEKKIDYLIILSSNNILRNEILSIEKLKVINFHTSKLPKYRGVLPIFRAYMNGENEIGFSIHEVTSKIDDGKILSQKIVHIKKKESLLELYIKAFKCFPSLINDAIEKPLNFPNDEKFSNYFSYPKLNVLIKFKFNEILKK